jgi:hypothetical protein
VKLSIPIHLVLNTGHITTVEVEQLMTEAVEFCALHYMDDSGPNVSGKLAFRGKRNRTAHGICVWFDTELYEDIGFSAGRSNCCIQTREF